MAKNIKVHLIEDIAVVDPNNEGNLLDTAMALQDHNSETRTYRKIACVGKNHCVVCNMPQLT